MTTFHSSLNEKINALQIRLESAGINLGAWGRGEAKTLRHLVQEVESGECSLIDVDGEIQRVLTVGGANIYYRSPEGNLYRLVEEKQVFTDGRERVRKDLPSSVSEKMKPEENPIDAIIRGIREELGVTGDFALEYHGQTEKTVESPSYPGLKSRYVAHNFTAYLSTEQFVPEGYVENQSDKSTFFVWRQVEEAEHE